MDTVGAEGAEAPTVFSPHSFCAYTQVAAYGSDAVHDPIKAAEAPPHSFNLCLRPYTVIVAICVYAPAQS